MEFQIWHAILKQKKIAYDIVNLGELLNYNHVYFFYFSIKLRKPIFLCF